ncbi:MAG: heavy metal translocating P-type ATPase [Chloroflexota bacterium]
MITTLTRHKNLVDKLIDKNSKQEETWPLTAKGIIDVGKRFYTGLFTDIRGQHRQTLTIADGSQGESKVIKTAKRNLAISTAGFISATIGAVLYPPFYLIAILCIIYPFTRMFQEAFHTLIHERKIGMNMVTVVTVVGALAGGLYWGAAMAVWFGRISRLLAAMTEDHSKKGLVNLFGNQPRSLWILVDGVEVEVPFNEVSVGDVVVIHAGQTIPIDGTIVSGIASIDQRVLTGEAQPVEKGFNEPVFTATMVQSGKIHVRMDKAGQETIAAQIGDILNQTTDYKFELQQKWEKKISFWAIPMLLIGGITWPIVGFGSALGILWFYPGFRMLVFGPMSLLTFLRLAAQHGILIKDGRSLEALIDIDTVVFDKTGTLTAEQPYVSHIYTYNKLSKEEILTYAVAAEQYQTHPIAHAILAAAAERGLSVIEIEHGQYEVGYGIKVEINGHTIWVGSDRFMEMENISLSDTIRTQQISSHEQGHSLVFVALDGVVEGAIELQPTIRPEVKEIVDDLKARHLDVMIISGDHEAPTRQLANELGIDRYFAQVLPEGKADLIEQLQTSGRSVCFVGDGINDTIALKKAHVSISLRGSTTIAMDTAQIVLMDESLQQLRYLFQLVQKYEKNSQENYLISTIPSFLGMACTFFFGWGFTTTAIVAQLSKPLGIYNSLKPLFEQQFQPE